MHLEDRGERGVLGVPYEKISHISCAFFKNAQEICDVRVIFKKKTDYSVGLGVFSASVGLGVDGTMGMGGMGVDGGAMAAIDGAAGKVADGADGGGVAGDATAALFFLREHTR